MSATSSRRVLLVALLGSLAPALAGAQAFDGGLWWPPYNGLDPDATAILTIDGDGEAVALVFEAPRGCTIATAGFAIDAIPNAPDNGLRVSLQTVGADGNPDGTQDVFRDIASPSTGWNETGLLSDDGTDEGAALTVTAGDVLGLVIEFVTFAAGDDVDVTFEEQSVARTPYSSFPYVRSFVPSTWSNQGSRRAAAGLTCDDGTYLDIDDAVVPASAVIDTTFSSGSDPDEIGNLFEVPFGVTVVGIWVAVDLDNDADLVLYDSDGTTALCTIAMDSDARISTGSDTQRRTCPAAVELDADTGYRVVLKPGASSSTINGRTFPEADALQALTGGESIHRTERTDAGSWTETTTARMLMGVLISEIDAAAGGGGTGGVCIGC